MSEEKDKNGEQKRELSAVYGDVEKAHEKSSSHAIGANHLSPAHPLNHF